MTKEGEVTRFYTYYQPEEKKKKTKLNYHESPYWKIWLGKVKVLWAQPAVITYQDGKVHVVTG